MATCKANKNDPGRLDQLAELQQPTSVVDPTSGQPIVSYSKVADVWCAIEALSGREAFWAQQLESQVKYKVTMRPYAGMTSEWRLIWEGLTLNIEFVPKAPRQDMITFNCMVQQ